MAVRHVEAFSDLLLVVQQVAGVCQCFDGSLSAYLDKCLKNIALFDDFTMHDVSRDENTMMNDLAQQASGFWSNRGKFGFLEKMDVPVCQTGQSSLRPMWSATICFAEPGSVKPDGLVSETEGSEIYRILDETSETPTADSDDWRTPMVRYLENPGCADRKVHQQAVKYVILHNTLITEQ
jgi:hypothetical protein